MKKIIILMLLILSVANADECQFLGDELILNGSFDNDFEGFYSDCIYLKNPPWNNNGVYTITNDPHSFMSPWSTFDDKSPSSNGKMFLTDAGSNVNAVLIGTIVTVKPDTKYRFSLWVARVNNVNPPVINVKINDVLQKSQTITELTGIWAKVEFVWNSLTYNKAKIEIFDGNPILYGNDFVIDEISLKECIPDDIKLEVFTNSPICEGDNLNLYANSIANADYHWYGPNGFSSILQNPVIINAKSINSGRYFFYVTRGGFISDTISIDIIVTSFLVSPGDSSLIFVGSAVKTSNKLKLTNAKAWDGGSVWLKNRFSVKNDFKTTFQFIVKNGDNSFVDDFSLPGADGIAFVIQNHSYPVLGEIGGSIGYTGITNSLAVEYDLYKNDYDPNGNHIAVQSSGNLPNNPDHKNTSTTLGINDQIFTIEQDSTYFSKIEYEWNSKTLKIYIDKTDNFTTPALTINNLDLSTYLNLEDGEYVYIGFTAGTGEAFQEHYIFNWTIPCKNQLVGVEDNNLKDNISDDLIAFPNPAENQFTILFNNEINIKGNYFIYDFLGKIVIEGIVAPGTKQININTDKIQSGIYSFVLEYPNEIKRMKLIINK
jgi:hypothetical protein